MKRKIFVLLLAILLPVCPKSLAQQVLEDYIKMGLESNLALQQKQSEYQKSIEALKEARSLFYPDISFNARYTVSKGGRTIVLPVGDMLNPVYSTLNMLTSSSMFPSIDNQTIRFLRPKEHETKIRLIQPVFNPDIYFNSKIHKEMTGYQEADMDQYRRELIAEIKKAYYNVSMSEGVLNMLRESRKLLEENVRVNRKLVENDKATRDVIYRSEAELGKFDQRLQEAEKDRLISGAYFNFLLNRQLGDSIIIQLPLSLPGIAELALAGEAPVPGQREEIRKLEELNQVADLNLKRNNAGKLPDIFLAVDYGFQGEKYEFNRDQEYAQASAVLTWSLFKGFQNREKIKQAMLDKKIVESRLEEAKKQIQLQVTNTLSQLKTSEAGISAAESVIINAKEAYCLIEKRYNNGQASLLEYIDARTTLTQASESLIIARYNYLICFAEFEKVAMYKNNE